MDEILQEVKAIKELTLLQAKNVLSIEDLALLLGLSVKTIRNNIDDYPHYHDASGKHVWFKRKEIEDWQCTIKHTPTRI